MTRLVFYIVLLSILQISWQKSTPQDTEYVAAALEYIVSSDVEQNILNYIHHIEEAAKQNADIIVFPELTLTNRSTTFVVPFHSLLKQYPIPALHPDLFDNIMVSISTAARNNQIYVVINGRESLDCRNNDTGEPCPELKEYVFNTNVVFDRNGAVIDRYRKINLFGEAGHTSALTPDLGYFETDFGVNFSHFICFDLMFQVPAVQSVQKLKVTDVLFTTMWFSELPYLTAVQIQEAYAYEMNINFIASGANNVAVGSAGSGIYSGKAGALTSIMPGVPTTRLLVSRVPKIPGQISGQYPGPIYDKPTDHDNLKLITDPSLRSHVSQLLVPGFQEITLVDKDVSCTFRVRLKYGTGDEFYKYRAVAFSGVRSFSGVATGGNKICGVVACTSDTLDTCGHRFTNYTRSAFGTFEELSILGRLPTPIMNESLGADEFVVYPVSVTSSIMPLETNTYTYNKVVNTEITVHDYSLSVHEVELYGFALWGRIFAPDGEEATPPINSPNSVADVGITSILIMIGLSLLIKYFM